VTDNAATGGVVSESEALFSVVSGAPTPSELAAVAAVIEGMVRESASLRRRATDAGPSNWEQSRRPVAVPIVPSRGAWNRGPSGV
jgi:hypothetical protein